MELSICIVLAMLPLRTFFSEGMREGSRNSAGQVTRKPVVPTEAWGTP